mgnify:CR=1 FL=1
MHRRIVAQNEGQQYDVGDKGIRVPKSVPHGHIEVQHDLQSHLESTRPLSLCNTHPLTPSPPQFRLPGNNEDENSAFWRGILLSQCIIFGRLGRGILSAG